MTKEERNIYAKRWYYANRKRLLEKEMIRLNHFTNLRPLDSYINRYVKKNKVA